MKIQKNIRKKTKIIGMYAPISGTGKIYDYRNQKPIGDGFTNPVLIWDKKCSYKELCDETKKLEDLLVK